MSRPFALYYKIKYFFSWFSLGIVFSHKGDTVVWVWPWARENKPKLISIGFSGTGEFGDARFKSLKDLDAEWKAFEEASIKFFDECSGPDIFDTQLP